MIVDNCWELSVLAQFSIINNNEKLKVHFLFHESVANWFPFIWVPWSSSQVQKKLLSFKAKPFVPWGFTLSCLLSVWCVKKPFIRCDQGRMWDLDLQHRDVWDVWVAVRSCFMNLASPRRPCRTPAAVWLPCRPAAPPAPASPQSSGRWPACSPRPRPWGNWAGTSSGWGRPRWSGSCRWRPRSGSAEGSGFDCGVSRKQTRVGSNYWDRTRGGQQMTPIRQIWTTLQIVSSWWVHCPTLNWLNFIAWPPAFCLMFDLLRHFSKHHSYVPDVLLFHSPAFDLWNSPGLLVLFRYLLFVSTLILIFEQNDIQVFYIKHTDYWANKIKISLFFSFSFLLIKPFFNWVTGVFKSQVSNSGPQPPAGIIQNMYC